MVTEPGERRVELTLTVATTLSLALHLLYLSLPLRHPYSVRNLGLVGSRDRNPSISTSGVFDILNAGAIKVYHYSRPTCQGRVQGSKHVITRSEMAAGQLQNWVTM